VRRLEQDQSTRDANRAFSACKLDEGPRAEEAGEMAHEGPEDTMIGSRLAANIFVRFRAFVRLGRPKFLVGGFALYALGAAIAAYLGHPIDWARYGWGQFAITATQLMTHYSNDYFDLEVDKMNCSNSHWSGGSGVLPSGELPRWVALAAAIALAGIALLATFVIETRLSGGSGALAILLAALVLSWEYSGPPLRLHSSGLGELVATVIVTLLVPLAGFYLQAHRVESLALVSVAPLCFLQFAMLLAVEFPDAAGDAMAGKRTLVVRMGPANAAWLYVAALALAYALLPAYRWWGLPAKAAWALAFLFPLAAWLAFRIARGEHRQPRYWDRISFGSAALVFLSTLLELGVYIELASSNQR